jgi:hypothetical protein
MAFTKILHSAKAADMIPATSVKRESEDSQGSMLPTRLAYGHLFSESYQRASYNVEAQARREVKERLEGADWYGISMFLQGLAPAYVHTGLCKLVESSRLFFALVEYFREYAVDFNVYVPPDTGSRHLKRALNLLVATIPDSCFQEERPDYARQELTATSQSEKAVLLAVRNFLILKASEDAPHAEAGNTFNKKTGYASFDLSSETDSSQRRNISRDTNCPHSPETQLTPTQATPSTSTGSASAQGGLKRKRSSSRSSILAGIVESTQNLESLCREQDKEIARLEALTDSRTETMRKTGELETKAHRFQKEARDWESEAKRLAQQNELLLADRAKHFNRAAQLEGETQSLKQDRDLVKQAWKFEITRKKAMKEMLMVVGGFKAESIEIAAKAISEGKKPRDAIADIIRSPDVDELD